MGDFLSSIGRLQAEQQKQVQEFQWFSLGFASTSGAIAQFVFKDLWTDLSSIVSMLTEKFNLLDTRVSNLESVISNKPISPQVISICNDLYVPKFYLFLGVLYADSLCFHVPYTHGIIDITILGTWLLLWVSTSNTTVFGVSTESIQLSFDPRDNSIPTILLIMQMHLYYQGGLQAEGIFKINAANNHEEFVRDQLNRGVVPEGTDVHCLAGLIKVTYRL
ncbi:Rho GTPase activating protein with PAK-box/P21-Rho-binding domain-containing protein [Perilla frutescens var. hirtella]|nr:Rho GTPase activating protein with PAK-box/P21-Rho-binding domain-containing protein [Perilla frutescens var. hirtella]